MTNNATPIPTTNKVAVTINAVATDIERYTPLAIHAVQQVEMILQHAPSQTKLNTAIAVISATAAASETIPIPEVQAVGGLVSLIAGLVQALYPHKTKSSAAQPTAAAVAAAIPVVDAVAAASGGSKQ
jgi:hypothetical protein